MPVSAAIRAGRRRALRAAARGLLGHLVAGVVRGAHQRPRFDVLEAERQASAFISANSSGWT